MTEQTKKRSLKEALQNSEFVAPPDSATQPVVKVLVGDCNLTRELAEEATQPLQPADQNYRTVWQVHATSFGESGDLILVQGANARMFDLPFGKKHSDRAIRNDCHDAIGI